MNNLKAKVICAGNCPICNKPLKDGECIFMCNECKIKNEKIMELENQKTGHWIETTLANGRKGMKCSNCGCEPIEDSLYGYVYSDYCPNCGAKMKGENNAEFEMQIKET